MSAALKSLEQQYAAEVFKPHAGDDLLKRLERGTRGLGVIEPAGQCSVGMHFQIQFGLLLCIVSEQITAASQSPVSVKGLLWGSGHVQLACVLTLLLRTCLANSQPPLWLDSSL